MTAAPLEESYWPADNARPILNISIGEALARTAAAVPDRIALVEVVPAGMDSQVGAGRTDRSWTYAELHADAARCAHWLLSQFDPGERICIWAPNVPEWVVLQYGAAMAGMILVTANPALKAAELEYVLRQSRSTSLFHLEGFRGVDTGALARQMEHLGIRRFSLDGWLTGLQAVRSVPLPSVDPGQPAQIQYTSGTTGSPKGALLHHRGLLTNASYVSARMGLDQSVVVSPMPLFHTAGSVLSVLGCLTSRSTLILPLLFEPKTVLGAIEANRADTLFGVPTMHLAVIESLHLASRDISTLRVAVSGGAPVSPELHKRIHDSCGCLLLTVYGQTELSPIVSQTGLNDPPEELINTTGRPLWNVEVRIADPVTSSVLPVGAEGEIQVRGYQMMIEYFDDAVATRQTIMPDGWLRTGDLGTMDAAGYLRVTGRLKDMVIRGGENIYPAEIEACLLRHADVADVAIFGAPDEKWGEVVAAAIRPAPGAQLNSEDLIAHCRSVMAPHKTPSLWFCCNEFPLTASGKVQKFRLREALADGSLQEIE